MSGDTINVDELDPDEVLREGVPPKWGGEDVTWGKTLTREYTHWIEEQRAWRESVALGDMTYMLFLHVEGPDALQLFIDTSINNFDGFDVGNVKHAVQCNENGKIISEGLLEYLGEEEFAIQGFPTPYIRHVAREGDYDVTTEVRHTNVYEVIGPNAADTMDAVTSDDPLAITFMNLGRIDIAGHEIPTLRHSLGGVPGFELIVPEDAASEIRQAILDAGEDYGIRQVGTNTWYTTTLESGLPQGNLHYIPALYADKVPKAFSVDGSYDSDDISDWYRSPVEFNWGHYADLDRDIIGRDALAAEIADPDRKLVTLEWDSEDVIDIYASLFSEGDHYKYQEMPTKQRAGMRADEVRKDGDLVGVSTTPGYLYNFRSMLSLTTMDVEYTDPGTEVTVVWGEGGTPKNPSVERHAQKEVRATVQPAPYEDAERRVDLK